MELNLPSPPEGTRWRVKKHSRNVDRLVLEEKRYGLWFKVTERMFTYHRQWSVRDAANACIGEYHRQKDRKSIYGIHT